jgi:hypothetical protein
VTVFLRNASDVLPSIGTSYSPSVGISSLPMSSPLGGVSTGLPSSSLPLSVSSQITALSTVPSTDVLSYDSLSLSTSLPSIDFSLSSGSLALTVPSTVAPTLSVSSVSISNLVGGSSSLPTLSVGLTSTSFDLPSSGVSASVSDLSLSGSAISLGLPTSVGSSLSLPSASLSASTLQVSATSLLHGLRDPLTYSKPSSLSNVLSTSVTLPVVSLTSGLTIPISSSATPSLGSLTLSPTLPTLPISGSLSDLSLSLATPTGLSIPPSSVSAATSLPSTLLSLSVPSGLSTLSLATTRTVGAIPTPSVLTTVYCPADDGLKYLSPDDRPFELACSKRRVGRYLSEGLAFDLESCVDRCSQRPDCQSVSYRPANGTCLLNSDIGSESPDGDWQSAWTTDLSCPGADNAQYMDHAGSVYQVLCDYSFPNSYNITTSPGRDYLDCSSQCSELLLCSGFAYTDGVCTLTSGLGALSTGSQRKGTNTVVLVSKRAVRIGPDNIPVVSTISIAPNPRTSMSSLLGSMTTLLPGASGISSLIGTSLPQITLVTSLTYSPAGLPSSLGSLTGTLLPPVTLDTSTPSSLISLPSNTGSLTGTLLPPITLDTNLLSSLSGLLSSLGSLTGTLLSPITLNTNLPSSLTILPSGLGLTSLGSIDASITNILPTVSSLPSLSISSVDVSGLSSLLSPIPTITVPSLTSIRLSSATLPTFQGPSQTAVSYTCPEFDGRVILENGLSYALNCSSIANGTPYASFPASSSFNDCFKACDQSSTEGGAKYCTAFTYEDADRGAGPGTCYLFNDVGENFLPANGRKAITAIRAVNYVAGPIEGGVSSILSSLLPGMTLPSTLSATTLIPSPSASLPSGIVTLPTSGGIPITTCSNGGNILNGCIDATATVSAGVGASGGVVLGPSGSPIISAGVSATLGVSLSADAGLGLSLSVGSSGLNLGASATLGVDLGVTASGGLGLGLGGGKPTTSTPVPAIASTTSRPASITTTPRLQSTTTVFTTSTITSCLTGSSGVLTCPYGGLFTTLPFTSGAVTSISTSTSTQTSVSVSISIVVSYVTVTAPATSSSSSTAALASTLSTMTISSSRSSSGSASSASSSAPPSTSTCKGTVNGLGLCIL